MLLAGAGMLLTTLLALQAAQTGFDTRQVLAINVPVVVVRPTPDRLVDFYREVIRRIAELPGVERVAVGMLVPWRDAGAFGPGFQFTARATPRPPAKRIRAADSAPCRPGFSRRSACR